MTWRIEWSRHYDQIQWTSTTILTGIIGGLLAHSYSIEVGHLDRVVVYSGFALTWLTVYYAASFREIRSLLHTKLPDGEEKNFLADMPHKMKQWQPFLIVFGLLTVAWLRLCWKHGWSVDAIICGVITGLVYASCYFIPRLSSASKR